MVIKHFPFSFAASCFFLAPPSVAEGDLVPSRGSGPLPRGLHHDGLQILLLQLILLELLDVFSDLLDIDITLSLLDGYFCTYGVSKQVNKSSFPLHSSKMSFIADAC